MPVLYSSVIARFATLCTLHVGLVHPIVLQILHLPSTWLFMVPNNRGTHALPSAYSLVQGPIDYTLYEAYGGGMGKAVSAVLNNAIVTRVVLGALASIMVSCTALDCP